jgi:hypothetical protein
LCGFRRSAAYALKVAFLRVCTLEEGAYHVSVSSTAARPPVISSLLVVHVLVARRRRSDYRTDEAEEGTAKRKGRKGRKGGVR